MRPIKMNKIGLLAAAIYSVLEAKRDRVKHLQDFVVNVDVITESNEYDIISGHLNFGTQSQLRKFKVYFDGAGNLVILITNGKKYYINDKVSVNIAGEVEINFKERSVTETTTKKWKYDNVKNICWDWKSVYGSALDIVGTILGEQNPF